MAAAAAALIAGIGALTLTGALGRVQRNSGLAFAIGLAFVVLGAAIWVIGALISREATPARIKGRNIGLSPAVQVCGVAVSLLGLIVALTAAISTANDMDQRYRHVRGRPT